MGVAFLAPRQQGIEQFQHARVAAQQVLHPGGLLIREPVEGGQAQGQLAALGPAQGRHGQCCQTGTRMRQGIAAGEQQLALAGGPGEVCQNIQHLGCQKSIARGREVLLEIVQYQQHPPGGEDGGNVLQTVPVLPVGFSEFFEGCLVIPLGLCRQGIGQGLGHGVQIQSALHRRHGPARFRQAQHHAPRQGALTNTAEAAQHQPARGLTTLAQQLQALP